MNTTTRLSSWVAQPNEAQIFRAKDISNAVPLLIVRLFNGWTMSDILRSYYPEEIDQVRKAIWLEESNLDAKSRRFLMQHSDSSLQLSQEERIYKKLIWVINYLLYWVGEVNTVFYDLLDITEAQMRKTVELYYPDYVNAIDIGKLMASMRSIRNGQQTRESFLKRKY